MKRRIEEQARRARNEAKASSPPQRRDWIEWVAIGLALVIVAWMKS